MITDTLVVIPARGGSKRLPGKNIKILGEKPLIYYSIEAARTLFSDDFICVTTDDIKIKAIVEETGLKVEFLRPQELASDLSTTQDVLLHALEFFNDKKLFKINKILLLQPTSPFRKTNHILEALSLYESTLDMVVSLKKAKTNLFSSLFLQHQTGWLRKINFEETNNASKDVYELNGSLYVINANSLIKKKISEFELVKGYVMEDMYSIDIDNEFDWVVASAFFNEIKKNKL